jgi:hypothetical protein
VVEEPTALAGDSLLPKPLSQQGDIESSEIEAVLKVCSFISHGMALGLNKARTATFIIPNPSFPPR